LRERALAAAIDAVQSTSPPETAVVAAVAAKPNPESGVPATLASRPHPAVSVDTGAAAGEGLYVQVGAFGDPQNAERLRERLTPQLAEQVRVQHPGAGGANLYKVRVGPLGSAGEARRVSAKLSTLGVSEPRVIWN
jgi:rare lipoprotein A